MEFNSKSKCEVNVGAIKVYSESTPISNKWRNKLNEQLRQMQNWVIKTKKTRLLQQLVNREIHELTEKTKM